MSLASGALRTYQKMALTLSHTFIISICIFTATEDFDVWVDILSRGLK